MRRQILPAVLIDGRLHAWCSASATRSWSPAIAQTRLPGQGQRIARGASTAGTSARAASGRRSSTRRATRSRSTSSRPSAAAGDPRSGRPTPSGRPRPPALSPSAPNGLEELVRPTPSLDYCVRRQDGSGRRRDESGPTTYVDRHVPQRTRELNGSAATKVPVDAVTASASGLDPHISVANARLQAQRGSPTSAELPSARCERLIDDHTDGPDARRSSARRRERARAEPRARPAVDEPDVGSAHGARQAPHLPRRRTRRRQDLRDAQRGPRARHERGTDVVVGFVETHGRPNTAAQIGDLEVVPAPADRATAAPTFEEMDVDAVLAREPQVGARRRARAHERPRVAEREALAGRRGAPRRRHRRHLDASTSSTSSRSTTSSSGSPASSSARRCPTRSCGAPSRSSSST